MSVVKPVFGNIGTINDSIDLAYEAKDKVQGQWHLFCLIHNIESCTITGSWLLELG
ncbi:hypothetical protein [Agaribacter marinus]|uniref:hypothetical protein n=1 Tax=Agaribacter marinus TaxID=1431249 RepID=UPI003D6701C4